MQTTIVRAIYALCGTVFCVAFLSGVVVYGDGLARRLALGAALCGALSQYIGQDPNWRPVSIGLAHFGMIVGAVALFIM